MPVVDWSQDSGNEELGGGEDIFLMTGGAEPAAFAGESEQCIKSTRGAMWLNTLACSAQGTDTLDTRASRGQRAVRVIHVFSGYGVVPRAAFFCTPLLANCAQTRESSRVCDACRLVLS